MTYKLTIGILLALLLAPKTHASSQNLTSFVEKIIENTVLPGIDQFSSRTNELKQQTQQYCQGNNSQSLEDLKVAWKAAYLSWKEIQLYGLGPTATLRVERHLDFWPTRHSRIQQMLDALDMSQAFSRAGVSAHGLPAMEWVLYQLSAIDKAKKCELLLLLTDDIDIRANELKSAWASTTSDSPLPTFIYSSNPAEEFINALVVGIYAVRKKSLIVPMGLTTGYMDTNRSEAIFSQSSTETFLIRLRSIIALFNDPDNGLIQWLSANKHIELADKFKAKVEPLLIFADSKPSNLIEMIQAKDESLIQLESHMNDLQFLIEQDLAHSFELIMFFKDLDGD